MELVQQRALDYEKCKEAVRWAQYETAARLVKEVQERVPVLRDGDGDVPMVPVTVATNTVCTTSDEEREAGA